MEFEKKSLPARPYIYVDREVSMADGAAIAEAMGSAFGQVFAFAQENGIAPQSMPMSIYMEMPKDGKMSFRGGVMVSEEDAAKATGDIRTD